MFIIAIIPVLLHMERVFSMQIVLKSYLEIG